MVIAVVPGDAVTVPPQVVVAAGEAATVNPVPSVVRLSVTDVIVAGVPDALVSVIVSVVTWVWTREFGEKALLPLMTVTGLTTRAADVAA